MERELAQLTSISLNVLLEIGNNLDKYYISNIAARYHTLKSFRKKYLFVCRHKLYFSYVVNEKKGI
uniref:Bm14482 n=1 Tax=Brugia malayi TaxID=6279 RepID=A0A1I9G4Y1_BRUMA|nr:Bm14482 [Brugia malayi]